MDNEVNSVPYGLTETDNGIIYSIDEMNIEYLIDTFDYDFITENICNIFNSFDSNFSKDNNSKLNMKPLVKYAFYNHHIFDLGIHISFGLWQKKEDDTFVSLPYLKIKFNPNKHFNSKVLNSLFEWILSHSVEQGYLVKYDFAMDYLGNPKFFHIHSSTKEHGLYKGTFYLGQRGEHGRVKKYHKSKQLNLNYEDTRIEYTFKTNKKRNFDSMFFLNPQLITDYEKLSPTLQNYVFMLLEIKRLNGDMDKFFNNLIYRTQVALRPFIYGSLSPYLPNELLIDKLLDTYGQMYHFTQNLSLERFKTINNDTCDIDIDDNVFASNEEEQLFIEEY